MKILVAPKTNLGKLANSGDTHTCMVGSCSSKNSCVVCRPYGPCAPMIYED